MGNILDYNFGIYPNYIELLLVKPFFSFNVPCHSQLLVVKRVVGGMGLTCTHAIVTSEMRPQVERVEEPAARHLSQPERAERIERQRAQLTGLTIKGSSEPSEALVDACVGQYEANVVQYVPWSKCTSREQELLGEGKKDVKLSIDAESGKLKVENKAKDQVADTSMEVMLLQALQRRALAYDQANIVSFVKLDLWHQKLMKARLTAPPPGYQQVSFSQLQNADSRLFMELQDQTRTGIQSERPAD